MMDELNAARAAGKVDSRLNDRQRAQIEALSGADLRRSADDHARYLAGLQATQEKEQAEAARQSNNAANMAYVQQGGFRNTSSSGQSAARSAPGSMSGRRGCSATPSAFRSTWTPGKPPGRYRT